VLITVALVNIVNLDIMFVVANFYMF